MNKINKFLARLREKRKLKKSEMNKKTLQLISQKFKGLLGSILNRNMKLENLEEMKKKSGKISQTIRIYKTGQTNSK